MTRKEEQVSKLELIGWRLATGFCYILVTSLFVGHILFGVGNYLVTFLSWIIILHVIVFLTRRLYVSELAFKRQKTTGGLLT